MPFQYARPKLIFFIVCSYVCLFFMLAKKISIKFFGKDILEQCVAFAHENDIDYG